MSEQIPAAVVTGRRVAMALLVTAIVITALLVVWLVASWSTQPVTI